MQNFMYKLQAFMRGRYGFDELGVALLILSTITNIVSRFIFNFPVRITLQFISLGLVAYFVFRFLSRNCYRRAKENDIVKPALTKTKDFFKITYRKFKDGRTHRYYKCPSCKAQLRVKNIKGEHTIRCPKCGNQFKKKIR